jgi:hypothetical protein
MHTRLRVYSNYLGVFELNAVQCCADVHFLSLIKMGARTSRDKLEGLGRRCGGEGEKEKEGKGKKRKKRREKKEQRRSTGVSF